MGLFDGEHLAPSPCLISSMVTAQHREPVNSASMALADLKAFTDGDDDGGSSFLANIHTEQKRLNNLEPSTNPGNSKVTGGKGYAPWLKLLAV